MPARIGVLADQKIMQTASGEKPRKLFDGADPRTRFDHVDIRSPPRLRCLTFIDGRSGRSEVYALFKKVQSVRGKAVVELLHDICAEVMQKCIDAGINESILIAGMTDASLTRRRQKQRRRLFPGAKKAINNAA